jgi:protein-tyrosine phosphatase
MDTLGPMLYPIINPTPGGLATMAHPHGFDRLDDEMAGLRDAGIDVLVSLQPEAEQAEVGLTGEAAAAARHGMEFRHLPVPDLGVPTADEVEPLVEALIEHLRAGRHVAIHCFAGIGRSSVLAAATLISLGATAEDACATISAARGFRVPETYEQRSWLDDWEARA